MNLVIGKRVELAIQKLKNWIIQRVSYRIQHSSPLWRVVFNTSTNSHAHKEHSKTTEEPI